MAGDLKIGIRLDADGKSFVGAIRLSKRELDKFTGAVGKGGSANARYARAADAADKARDMLFGGVGIAADSKPTAFGTAVGYVVIDPQKLLYLLRHFEHHRERFAGRILPTLQDVDEVREIFVKGERRWRFMKAWDDGKATMVITVDVDGKETVINMVPKTLKGIESQRGPDTRLIYRRPPEGNAGGEEE